MKIGTSFLDLLLYCLIHKSFGPSWQQCIKNDFESNVLNPLGHPPGFPKCG